MQRVCWLLGFVIFLTGCTQENRELASAMQLRENILSAQVCSFQANVTADYGDSLCSFSMDCQTDPAGTVRFEVTGPRSIAGIKGNISDTGGNITFDDQALYFPLLTDDLLVPASAPWIFMKTLRSGYITAVCMEDGLLHMTVNDSYADDALTLDIWLNEEHLPVRGDILHDGTRILSLEVENFRIL